MESRMTKVVLDASAFLTLIRNDEGAEKVEKALPTSVMSTVSLATIITELNSNIGIPEEQVAPIIALIPKVIEFTKEQAWIAALMYNITEQYGIPLEDRAALSLAKQLELPIMTAAIHWEELKIDIEMIHIR